MFFRNICCALVLLTLVNLNSTAQSSEFYDGVTTIMRDAPNQFRNIRGKTVSDNFFAIVWESGIKLPGALAARFVFSKGMSYECAFLQTNNIADVKGVYDRYVSLLDSCLKPMGYTMSLSDNFFPGMAEYKKVAFLPEIDPEKGEKSKPHLAIEVTYSKEKQLYTVVLFIYEH